MGQVSVDKSLPVISNVPGFHGGRQVVFLEPIVRKNPGKPLVTNENRGRSTPGKGLCNGDTVQGRTKAGLGEKGDGRAMGHLALRGIGGLPRLAASGR